MNDAQVTAMREQEEFLRVQQEARNQRIRRVAADNPDIPLCLLAERFGISATTIGKIVGRKPDVDDP